MNWMRRNRMEYRCSKRLADYSSILNSELFGLWKGEFVLLGVQQSVFPGVHIEFCPGNGISADIPLVKAPLGTIKASSPLVFHTVLVIHHAIMAVTKNSLAAAKRSTICLNPKNLHR